MADEEDSTRNERLDEIIADYLRRVAAGETPDRQELLASRPELADDLRSFFAEHDKMEALADAARGDEVRDQARDALTQKNRADDNAKESKTNAELADQKAAEAIATAERERLQKDRADEKTKEARRHLYAAQMNLAQAAWENNHVGRLRELLGKTQPQPGENDLRGFEWHYWNRLAHSYQLSLEGHTGAVTSVTFSQDGKRLASASHDRTVKVWDVMSGQEALTLKGHTCVAFSLDGRRLAAADGVYGRPGELKVWDATSGQETLTLKGHSGAVMRVAFSPDGTRLASAGDDGTVKVWDARPWTPELRVEQEALSVVRFYTSSPIARDELLARIRADATISEAVRERALEFAREWRLD